MEGSERPGALPKAMWIALAAMFISIVAAVLAWQFLRPKPTAAYTARGSQASSLLPMDQAGQYAAAGEYAKAEEIYRGLLVADPKDARVIKALASVLFRQDKTEESAKVLNTLSPDRTAHQ